MTALVRVFPGRPPWVRVNGAWICLSVLDGAWFDTRSRLRAAMIREPHAAKRQSILLRWRTFRAGALKEYQTLGWPPPKVDFTPTRGRLAICLCHCCQRRRASARASAYRPRRRGPSSSPRAVYMRAYRRKKGTPVCLAS